MRVLSLVPHLSTGRPWSPIFPHAHGMVSPSAIVLVLYTFCVALGSFGEFYLFKQLPGSSLFVDPHFSLGYWQYQYAPSHVYLVFPSSPTLVRALFPKMRMRLDVYLPVNNLILLYSFSVSAFSPFTSPPNHPTLDGTSAESSLRSLHLYITRVLPLTIWPPACQSARL